MDEAQLSHKMPHIPSIPLQNASESNQDYGREDLPYVGFIVIIVGYFQQLLPICDKTMYTEGNEEASLLFTNIQNVVILKQPQRQVGNSPEELKFQQILQNCQEGSLTEQDWMDLSEQFVVTASDSNDVIWDQAH